VCEGTPFEEWLADDDSLSPSGYMEIDEFTNAVDDLKQTISALSRFDNKFRWKWVVLGLDRALYGFMICMLKGSNYRHVLDWRKAPKAVKEARKRFYSNDSSSHREGDDDILRNYSLGEKARLISFHNAFERIQDSRMTIQPFVSRGIQLTDSEKASVNELHRDFRNMFAHFRPTLWLINELKFPPLLLDTVAVIRKILESGILTSFRSSLEDLGESPESLCQTLDVAEDLIRVNQRYVERQQGLQSSPST